MDDIDQELINLLYTKVGMLMEDHSAQAITMGSSSEGEQKAAINSLVDASKQIAALTAAAQSISE